MTMDVYEQVRLHGGRWLHNKPESGLVVSGSHYYTPQDYVRYRIDVKRSFQRWGSWLRKHSHEYGNRSTLKRPIFTSLSWSDFITFNTGI